MADYDYGNARLRVMKSRLLPRSELEVLAEAGSLDGLIAALTKTVYQKSSKPPLRVLPVCGASMRHLGLISSIPLGR
jgi:hypothetical protein